MIVEREEEAMAAGDDTWYSVVGVGFAAEDCMDAAGDYDSGIERWWEREASV